MTQEELEAIDKFQYFKEGDVITKDMVKNKDIVMDLILKLQRELEEIKSNEIPEVTPVPDIMRFKTDHARIWSPFITNPYTMRLNHE